MVCLGRRPVDIFCGKPTTVLRGSVAVEATTVGARRSASPLSGAVDAAPAVPAEPVTPKATAALVGCELIVRRTALPALPVFPSPAAVRSGPRLPVCAERLGVPVVGLGVPMMLLESVNSSQFLHDE